MGCGWVKRLFLIFFVLIAVRAEAAIYYTDKNHGSASDSNACTAEALPCLTISGGLGKMSAGDTLTIKAGVYAEFIDSTQLTSGIDANSPTLIQGATGETVIIRPAAPGGAASGVVWIQNKTNITFKNLDFDGVNTAGVGFYLNGGSETGIKIQDSVVRNSTGESCIVMVGSNHEVSGSTIHNCGDLSPEHGIYLAASDSLVERNTVYDINNGYGIHVWKNTDTLSGTVVRRNLIYNIASAHGYVVGNQAGTASGNLFYNNVVRSSAGGARVYVNSDGNKIFNNTFYSNTTCIDVESGSANAVVQNNFCLSNTTNTVQDSGTGTTADHNVSSTDTSLVVNAAGGDFHLNSGASSLIDQGADLSATFTTDYAGNTRSLPFDIGAYEFLESCPSTPQQVLNLHFDEGSGLPQDSSGNLNHVSDLGTGNSWTASGESGSAISFGGTAAATVPNSNSLFFCNKFTLAAWIKPTNSPVDGTGVLVKDYKYFLYSASSGFCATGAPIGGYFDATYVAACSTTLITPNIWTHLAVTYDSMLANNNIKLWVNGLNVGSTDGTLTIPSSTGLLYIGGSNFGEYFTGTIDEVRAWNSALTGAEIITEMGSATPNAPTGFRIQ
jgi:hypothetical protein